MRPFLLIFCLLIPFMGTTQSLIDDRQPDVLGKGRVNVGLRVGQGYRHQDITTTLFTPQIQYFIANGWSISAEGRYLTNNVHSQPSSVLDYTYTFLGGGLSTRYYFLRRKRLALFAYASAVYGRSVYRLSPDVSGSLSTPSRTWQTELGLGAQYRLGKRWSVEALAGRSWLTNNPAPGYLLPPYFHPSPQLDRWQFGIGLIYHLR